MDVTFPFDDIGESFFGRVWRPVAKVNLASPVSGKTVDIWMVVDTGADFTILPYLLSKKLRISIETDCVRDNTIGVGGSQTIYYCKKKFQARLGTIERSIPLAFIEGNTIPPILGRLGFLETFDVTFSKDHKARFSS